MIHSPIENGYNEVDFDDGNGGVNTEPLQKVILQVSVC